MTTMARTDMPLDLASQAVRGAAHPLVGAAEDDDPLLECIGDPDRDPRAKGGQQGFEPPGG